MYNSKITVACRHRRRRSRRRNCRSNVHFFRSFLNNKVLKVWWPWLDKMKVTNIASTLFNCFVFAVFRRIGAMRDEFIDAPNYNGYETGAGSILF